MAKSGINELTLRKLGCDVRCYMAEEEIVIAARIVGVTRAVASMRKAARDLPDAIYAVGNAPTALFEICDLVEKGLRPPLVIGVPVGFVNVLESKERLLKVCREYGIPAIIAMGNKGGSTLSAAICNALLYSAIDAVRPENRQ
jgi:precorrin-8X/cobalt-precorrin-8 methylmutase